jgi:hypothetical protein
MSTFSSLLVLTLAALVFFLPASYGVNLAQRVHTGQGFSISVPEKWVQLPPEVLKELVEKTSAINTQKFEFAFQQNAGPPWFSYPYIMIQVNSEGRIPERTFSRLDRVKAGMQKGFSSVEKKATGLLSNSSVGNAIYDSNAHILWSSASTRVEGIGPIKCLIAACLTEKGYVNVLGYAKADDFAAYRGLFEDIARNVEFDASLTYKPHPEDSAAYAWGNLMGRITTDYSLASFLF